MKNGTQVQAKSAVDVVARIGVGIVFAGAFGAIIGLSYALVQISGDGGGGGGGGTTNSTSGSTTTSIKVSSLKVVSITGASVVVDNDRAAQTLTFEAGTTVLGTQNGSSTFVQGSTLPSNQDLTLKFSSPPANDQMVIITYRGVQDTSDHVLTLCVGSGNTTTLYVTTDGSTFGDSTLKKRTTKEACGSIRSRALRPTNLDSGQIAAEFSRTWSQLNKFNLYRGTNLIAWFNTGLFQDETTVVAEEGDPLRMVLSEFGTQLSNDVVSPRSLLTISTAPRATSDEGWGLKPASPTWPVCIPEVAYNVSTRTGYRMFYFDTNGTPYTDIFLQTKAMSGTCSGTVDRALRFSRIDTGSIAYGSSSTWNQYGQYGRFKLVHGSGALMALFYSDGQFVEGVSGLNLNTVEFLYDPLSARPSYAYSLSPISQMTYPRAVAKLTGVVAPTSGSGPMQAISASICFPEQVVTLPSNEGYFYTFFDKQGNPYRDVFLENRLSCDRSGLTPQ